MSWEEYAGSTIPALKPGGSPAPSSKPFRLARVPGTIDTFFHADTCSSMPSGTTTIVMAAYNNNDILMVPYEDLPDGDKDVISKAIEEF